MKSLSIVIPVYNGGELIERCVESIAQQNNGSIEIVIVNDGSTDNTGTICLELANKYSFVKYFEKENGGVSSARNFALKVVTGEYVWFVDADDYITADAISKVFKVETDLAVFNFAQLNQKVKKEVNVVSQENVHILASMNDFFMDYIFPYKLNNALWNKVFKTNIIREHRLTFNETVKIGEDYLFSLCYYKLVQEICFSTTPIYMYYINEGGAMKSKNTAVFSYQQEIANTVKTLYADDLNVTVMQQFLLMQLVCAVNQSKERGVDKKTLRQYVKSYMRNVMEGKRFSRQVVNNFLNSEGAGFLSKIKFKLNYFNIIK